MKHNSQTEMQGVPDGALFPSLCIVSGAADTYQDKMEWIKAQPLAAAWPDSKDWSGIKSFWTT